MKTVRTGVEVNVVVGGDARLIKEVDAKGGRKRTQQLQGAINDVWAWNLGGGEDAGEGEKR